jgi:2-deoxy-D-gluconate 3-dehydrogenase
MKLFDLTGRVAIVTGGNGGIGLGLAEGLAEAGATVAITGRNPRKGEEAVATLRALGAQVQFIEADIAHEDAIQRMAETVAERFGGIDILVNNAGIHVGNAASAMTLDEWNADLNVNLTGAFLCSKAVYPYLVARGGGKIINISSVGAFLGQPYAPNYAASKGGAISLTKALAVEWAAQNIQVNAILPGLVLTEMTGPGKKAAPDFDKMVKQRTPAKRWGHPEDFRGVGVFLASDASAFVTGTAIIVDGGYSLPLYS